MELYSGYALPMRKTLVPQLGQTPLTAGLPFLSVTFVGFLISICALHFTQYAWGILMVPSEAGSALMWYKTLTWEHENNTREPVDLRMF